MMASVPVTARPGTPPDTGGIDEGLCLPRSTPSPSETGTDRIGRAHVHHDSARSQMRRASALHRVRARSCRWGSNMMTTLGRCNGGPQCRWPRVRRRAAKFSGAPVSRRSKPRHRIAGLESGKAPIGTPHVTRAPITATGADGNDCVAHRLVPLRSGECAPVPRLVPRFRSS